MKKSTEAVDWLKNMRLALAAARQVLHETNARTAPEFNTLDFARTDEYGISVMLASLLDPESTHGQKDAFLKSFLGHFWPTQPQNCADAQVKVESAAEHIQNTRRRLDIRVRLPGKAVFAIENKVRDAVDQDDQVEDYLAELRSESADHLLIYLTREVDQSPCENSIGKDDCKEALKDGRLMLLGVPQLIPWLNECIGICESERVRGFLIELKHFMRTKLMGISNITEHELIVRAALSNAEDVKAALQIGAAHSTIKRALFERFKEKLRDSIVSGTNSIWAGWTVDVSEDLLVGGGGVNLNPPGGSRYAIRLSFDTSGGNEANVGICAIRRDGEADYEQLRPILAERLGHGRSSEHRWPWWKPIWPNNNFGNDPETMATMLNDAQGALVCRVREVLDEIRAPLDGIALESMR